jgi:uncharacterized protein (TIGR02186 family)
MRLPARIAIPAIIAAALLPMASMAQDGERENITIGLSSDTVQIATNFTGSDLTIFGSVNNAKADALATGGYDVVVVLEGPPKPITIREKKRIFGMWVNADAFSFRDVPRSYVLAATRNLRDVSPEATFRQLSLGVDMRFFEPVTENPSPARLAYFSTALREQKIASGLYREGVGDVRFLSQSLFKASLFLPADIPLGTHRARAFLFKNGVFVDEDSTGLYVAKDSFEQWLFNSAQQHGFFYGLAAVALAIFVGWAGRLLFRRD